MYPVLTLERVRREGTYDIAMLVHAERDRRIPCFDEATGYIQDTAVMILHVERAALSVKIYQR